EDEFLLYGEALPICKSFRYLSIPFSSGGIDRDLLLRQSNTKAITAMRLLRDSGVYMYGFDLTAALRAYKIFARPIVEYGVAICHLTADIVKSLDDTQ
ncbi:hypothetical protein EC973_000343, partial [Apophysomyces ossiformis]